MRKALLGSSAFDGIAVFSASDLHAKFMQAEKPRQHRVRMLAPPKMLSVGTPIYISVIFQCKLNLVNAREEMCVRHKCRASKWGARF